MKFNRLVLLAPVALFSLSSCAMHKRHDASEYCLRYDTVAGKQALDDDDDFNILQLSDIHMGVMDDAETHYAFIRKTIRGAKSILAQDNRNLHLIVITGDVFTFADKSTVKSLCNFFESEGVPWTLTFGNHDEQGYFSIDWLTSYLNDLSKKAGSHLLFKDILNDDVFGNANFVINIPIFGEQSRQIIMLDSNRYNYGEGYGYDYIHTDQIDWYKRIYEYVTLPDGNALLEPNSLAFFHIPIPEFLDAYNDAKDPDKENSKFLFSKVYKPSGNDWEKVADEYERKDHRDTSEGSPEVNTHFFDVLQTLGYTKGLFVGHAHTNTNCMDYRLSIGESNTIGFCYGIKSTDRIYYDNDMIGGQLIHYHSEPKAGEAHIGSDWFDLDLLLHTYADLKENE